MRKIYPLMIMACIFTVVGNDAFAGDKKQCAKAVGKTAFYGGKSAAGVGFAAMDLSRGGTGNGGIHTAVTSWDKAKQSSKDVKKYCFPSK